VHKPYVPAISTRNDLNLSQIDNAKAWPAFLPHLGLPEEYMDPQTNAPIPVARVLRDHYMTILGPFEQMYRRNMHEQHKKLQMSQSQSSFADPQYLARQTAGMSNLPQSGVRPMSSNGIMPQSMAGPNGLGQFLQGGNQQRAALAANDSHSSLTSDLDTLPQPVDADLLDQDMQGIKRKHDNDGTETKRARQKTGSAFL
jgi:SWI/SNF chromatin-remodeling complex subunit SWI1